jgi:hypothetical protein
VARWLNGGERVLLTLWVGGLWVSGYMVAPSLFATLDDRHLAGQLAGNIFRLMSYVGLACGLVLLALAVGHARRQWLKSWRVWGLVSMLALVALGVFLIQPQMELLKASGLVEGSAEAHQFGRLHGVSSLLFLINSLLGLLFVVAGVRPKAG